MTDRIQSLCDKAGVKVSPVRSLVMRVLLQAESPLCAQDIECRLGTVDRSSITRALALFSDKGPVHTIEDGSGSVKYEICHAAGAHDHHNDLHPHFYCTQCGSTFCFCDTSVPEIALPGGFVPMSLNYIVKGLCPECAAKTKQHN